LACSLFHKDDLGQKITINFYVNLTYINNSTWIINMSISKTKGAYCISVILLAIFTLVKQSYASESSLSKARKTQLTHIVKQDCGSCHGMTLKGGLGPALLAENLQQKSILFIQNTILYGRSGTAMPPWKTLLTEQEALWIAEQLKQGNIHNINDNKDN